MKCEEPTTCLVNTFGNEIRRKHSLERFFIFKRIVNLRVRHRTRIEPNIDNIRFAVHLLTFRRNKNNIVNVWAVNVEFVIVFF